MAGLAAALELLDIETVTIAGEGKADRIVPGLSASWRTGPDRALLEAAFADLDLVVVENMFSLPLHVPASLAVGEVLAGRPALVRHHDFPWQRQQFQDVRELPLTDPAWLPISICEHSQREAAVRGVASETAYVSLVAPAQPLVDPDRVRRGLGVGPDDILWLHPVRAIPRKNISTALEVVAGVGGSYWLTGPAEEGYGADAKRQLACSGVRTIWRGYDDMGIDSAYAAADVILFPSTWEGCGLPPIEAAMRGRLAVVGSYPVADEWRELGFQWPRPDERRWLAQLMRDDALRAEVVARNHELAMRWFTVEVAAERLGALLDSRGWLPAVPTSKTILDRRLEMV
ncbi:MAG TPA: glycosyltransferase family 4 protein [Jatrophihabitantaceae bacterium]|nr:glycosyltransferase family 4 protein [Jatrophihabitantaceae bacterium]